MKFIENDENVSVQAVRSLGYLCYHCLEKYLTITKVKSHISSQHVGPVNCKMCGVDCEDLRVMNNHIKLCSYTCGVEGCERVHKRLSEAISHKNKFLKSMK